METELLVVSLCWPSGEVSRDEVVITALLGRAVSLCCGAGVVGWVPLCMLGGNTQDVFGSDFLVFWGFFWYDFRGFEICFAGTSCQQHSSHVLVSVDVWLG